MGQIVLLFGPPGVGKGTQARELAHYLNIPHIATGDMFREAIRSGSAVGRTAQAYMDRGELVPDDVVVDMVADRVAQQDAGDGFLLDGFPRTVPQARSFSDLLARLGREVGAVIVLDAPTAVLVERITGRRTCQKCGASYHLTYSPPRVAGVCDRCASVLLQRADDNEGTVRARLVEYERKTAPLVAHFAEQRWVVRHVDGAAPIDEVAQRLRAALGV